MAASAVVILTAINGVQSSSGIATSTISAPKSSKTLDAIIKTALRIKEIRANDIRNANKDNINEMVELVSVNNVQYQINNSKNIHQFSHLPMNYKTKKCQKFYLGYEI